MGELLGLSTVTAITATKRYTYQSTVAPISDYGWVWAVTFTEQSGDLPSLLVYTGQKTSTIAAGGTLLGTGTKVTVTEAVKGVLPTYFVTPPALAPGTTYFARVSAYNSEGWSTPAVAALSTTTKDQLPAAPLDVAVSVYDSTSLEVSWTAPPHTGGEQISRFLVQWDQDESFDDSTGTAIKEAVAGQTVYTYLITGLTAATVNLLSLSRWARSRRSSKLPYRTPTVLSCSRTGKLPTSSTSLPVEGVSRLSPYKWCVGLVSSGRSARFRQRRRCGCDASRPLK